MRFTDTIAAAQAQITLLSIQAAQTEGPMALLQKMNPAAAKGIGKTKMDGSLLSFFMALSEHLGDAEEADEPEDEAVDEVSAAAWNEALHPRANDGRFGGGGSKNANSSKSKESDAASTYTPPKVDQKAKAAAVQEAQEAGLTVGVAAAMAPFVDGYKAHPNLAKVAGTDAKDAASQANTIAEAGLKQAQSAFSSYTNDMALDDAPGDLGIDQKKFNQAMSNPQFKTEVDAYVEANRAIGALYSKQSIALLRKQVKQKNGQDLESYQVAARVTQEAVGVALEGMKHVNKAKEIASKIK